MWRKWRGDKSGVATARCWTSANACARYSCTRNTCTGTCPASTRSCAPGSCPRTTRAGPCTTRTATAAASPTAFCDDH